MPMMTFHKQEIRDIILATAVLSFAFGGLSKFFEALFAVGIAFIAHELIGHKLVAQRFGAEAEFKAWPMGLLLALVTSFFGFIFAAPGAVYIFAGNYYHLALLLFAANISFFLALFNLIPFDPLDGAKVMRWSKPAW